MVYMYIPPRYKRPQVYLEEPRRLTIPIVISHYRHNPSTTVQVVERPRRWSIRHQQPGQNQSKVKRRTICQWYKRKRALRELENDRKRTEKLLLDKRIEKERRERELQVIEHFKLQEQLKLKEEARLDKELRAQKEVQYQDNSYASSSYGKTPKVKQTLKKKWKPKKFKANQTLAKPKAASRSVNVKKNNRYERLSVHFVNCFYRICCQFYCYLTCCMIIAFVYIFVV